MRTIKQLSNRIEQEQTKKLQDLGGGSNSNGGSSTNLPSTLAPSRNGFASMNGAAADADGDFEHLVFGKKGKSAANNDDPWGGMAATTPSPRASQPVAAAAGPSFSWSTPAPAAGAGGFGATSAGTLRPTSGAQRSVTPDQHVSMSSFSTLQPNRTGGSQPLQPGRPGISSATSAMGSLSMSSTALQPSSQQRTMSSGGGVAVDWSSAAKKPQAQDASHPTILYGQTRQQPAPVRNANEFAGFGIAPPPASSASSGAAVPSYGGGLGGAGGLAGLNLSRPPAGPQGGMAMGMGGMGMGMGMGMQQGGMGMGMGMGMMQQQQKQGASAPMGKNNQKSGLDAFESLL